MTKQQGAPEAPKGTASDGKTELFNVPGYPLMVRAVDFNRLHAENERLVALVEAQQPSPSAAAAPDGWESVIHEIRSGLVDSEPSGYDNSGYRSFAGTVLDAVEDGLLKLAAPQPSPAPQADSQPAPATWLTDPAPTPEREFAEWLNAQRGFPVSAVFHEIMRKFAARAPADSVLEDAARWQETLMHVGAANHLGGQHFTLNTLRIRDQMFLLRGSVAQHFTACIDDSRAARKQGANHD